jgi:hypothetical protein
MLPPQATDNLDHFELLKLDPACLKSHVDGPVMNAVVARVAWASRPLVKGVVVGSVVWLCKSRAFSHEVGQPAPIGHAGLDRSHSPDQLQQHQSRSLPAIRANHRLQFAHFVVPLAFDGLLREPPLAPLFDQTTPRVTCAPAILFAATLSSPSRNSAFLRCEPYRMFLISQRNASRPAGRNNGLPTPSVSFHRLQLLCFPP